jgi:hypothetical protein
MKYVLFGALLLVCLSLPLDAAVEAPASIDITAATFSVLKYFPGDVVHLVVDVPPDVVSVTALMPDGEQLNLGFSRRSRVWHNYWEVPSGFKKGGYTAKLRAVDVEGRIFEGESDLFYVGEPTLPMVMRLVPSREARVLPPVFVKGKVERKPKAKVKVKVVKQAKRKPRAVKNVRVVAQPEAPSRMRLLVEAREQLFKNDYGKLKTKLDALLKIDPDNNEIRALRNKAAKGTKIK